MWTGKIAGGSAAYHGNRGGGDFGDGYHLHVFTDGTSYYVSIGGKLIG